MCADYVTFDGVDMDDAVVHVDRLRAAVDAASAPAHVRLRAWVNREHDERPTRDELRADVETVLDELLRLHELIAELRNADGREAKAVAERDELREALAGVRERAAKYRVERDAWHAAARANTAGTAKLREARDSARNLRDEYHEAYHQAEDERNTLSRENARLRGELADARVTAALRGDALVLRLAVPGGDR